VLSRLSEVPGFELRRPIISFVRSEMYVLYRLLHLKHRRKFSRKVGTGSAFRERSETKKGHRIENFSIVADLLWWSLPSSFLLYFLIIVERKGDTYKKNVEREKPQTVF